MQGIYKQEKIPTEWRDNVYKTVVRPAMMYGAETWAVKKAQYNTLEVAEMRLFKSNKVLFSHTL